MVPETVFGSHAATVVSRWPAETTAADATAYQALVNSVTEAANAGAAAENASHVMLSAHRDETFGVEYGVLIREWRLLQRSVFVIDAADRIIYAEYVTDQMMEPDYDATMAAVERAQADGADRAGL